MAMSIGGENRLGHIERVHIERFADRSGMEREACLNLMANLCERIISLVPQVMSEVAAEGASGIDELANRLIPRVESHCKRTLQQL